MPNEISQDHLQRVCSIIDYLRDVRLRAEHLDGAATVADAMTLSKEFEEKAVHWTEKVQDLMDMEDPDEERMEEARWNRSHFKKLARRFDDAHYQLTNYFDPEEEVTGLINDLLVEKRRLVRYLLDRGTIDASQATLYREKHSDIQAA